MSKMNISAFATSLQGKVKASMEQPAPIKEVKVAAEPKTAKKEKKAYNFALRIKGEIYEELVARAESEEMSLNKAINKAIEEYLRRA